MSTKCRRKMQLSDLGEIYCNGMLFDANSGIGASEHAFVAKTEIAVVADDDVIEDAHAHDFADFF